MAHRRTRISRTHRRTRISRTQRRTRISRTHRRTKISRTHRRTRIYRTHRSFVEAVEELETLIQETLHSINSSSHPCWKSCKVLYVWHYFLISSGFWWVCNTFIYNFLKVEKSTCVLTFSHSWKILRINNKPMCYALIYH